MFVPKRWHWIGEKVRWLLNLILFPLGEIEAYPQCPFCFKPIDPRVYEQHLERMHADDLAAWRAQQSMDD